MSYSAAAHSLPTSRSQDVIRRTVHYMKAANLTQLDLATRIGYSRPILNRFLCGKYVKEDGSLAAALTEYMNRNPLAQRIEIKGKLYDTRNVALIRQCFERALYGHCAYYFRGAPGCQKTFVLEHLIAELDREEIVKPIPERRAFLIRCRVGIKPCDLLKRVAMAAGVPTVGNTDRIINNLRHELRHGRNLLVFDEAQFLSIACLETLRELLDLGIIGLLFAGSHQLEDTFERLDMAQWRSRIRKGEGLPGLSEDEARAILKAELPRIAADSLATIVRKSYEVDYHRGKKHSYISARLLFWSILEIHSKLQSNAVGQEGKSCQ